jgi:hypothetical protein
MFWNLAMFYYRFANTAEVFFCVMLFGPVYVFVNPLDVSFDVRFFTVDPIQGCGLRFAEQNPPSRQSAFSSLSEKQLPCFFNSNLESNVSPVCPMIQFLPVVVANFSVAFEIRMVFSPPAFRAATAMTIARVQALRERSITSTAIAFKQPIPSRFGDVDWLACLLNDNAFAESSAYQCF